MGGEEEEVKVSNHIPKRGVKRKKVAIVVDNIDRISCLPDCLLLEILSHLDMEQVINTSLLSKRWRYLWRSTLCLNFRFFANRYDIDKTNSIDKCLSHHEKTKVRELYICTMYNDKDTLRVDSWIDFAITTQVAKLKLDLIGRVYAYFWSHTFYKLPHSLFECGSLITELTLSFCNLNLPASIQLMSLKTLILHHIDLSSDAIERLTSSSPVLENLHVEDCNRFSSLNITIENEHVKNLKIEDNFPGGNDHVNDSYSITVYAPNVLSLHFCSVISREYHINNLHSVTRANLGSANKLYTDDGPGPHDYLVEVLNCLHQVKELELPSSCIQVLSLRYLEDLWPLFIQATSIKLCLQFTKLELPGIAYLLQSAPRLENLSISIGYFEEIVMEEDFEGKLNYHEKSYWDACGSSWVENIKTINISGFHRRCSVFDDDPRDPCFPDLRRCLENETEFVRYLLREATALERMVIKIARPHRSRVATIKVIGMVSRKLAEFDKASPSVEILIT